MSIHNGEINNEDVNQIEKFLLDIEKVNIAKHGKNIIENGFKKETIVNECKVSSKVVEVAVKQWFEKYLKMLDEKLSLAVETSMKEKHQAKCQIPKALYNFTNNTVSEDLLEQIEHGIKNVPTIKKDGVKVVKNSLLEILHNLKMFRRFKQRRFSINQFEVRKWLEAAIDDDEDTDDEYKDYHKHLACQRNLR